MKKLSALCCLAALASCDAVSRTYVVADESTYMVIAPEYTKYVMADPSLDDGSRAIRLRTLETWRLRIEANKKEAPK